MMYFRYLANHVIAAIVVRDPRDDPFLWPAQPDRGSPTSEDHRGRRVSLDDPIVDAARLFTLYSILPLSGMMLSNRTDPATVVVVTESAIVEAAASYAHPIPRHKVEALDICRHRT